MTSVGNRSNANVLTHSHQINANILTHTSQRTQGAANRGAGTSGGVVSVRKRDFRQATHKNIAIADLRSFIEKKLEQMIDQNRMRVAFAIRLQEIIDSYNAGSSSSDVYFNEALTRQMREEAERHVCEGLTDKSELASFKIQGFCQ